MTTAANVVVLFTTATLLTLVTHRMDARSMLGTAVQMLWRRRRFEHDGQPVRTIFRIVPASCGATWISRSLWPCYCWHENESESEALWRLYCPSPSAGVAIQTTFSKLGQSLGDRLDIEIGRIKYIDFRRDFADPNGAIFRKRKSLSHEREVRAVLHLPDRPGEAGLLEPVDMSVLLQGVTISPFAPSWFRAVLTETMSKFGARTEIVESELVADPFF